VLNGHVDLRHIHLLLDLMNPVVVDLVSLGRRGEAEDCGRQAGSGETGDSCESELLHFSAFFSYLWGLSSMPFDGLNSEVRRLIPVAEIDRRLAAIAA
jgi:hypothetical protein